MIWTECIPNFSIEGTNIPWKQEVKYLDTTLDQKLNWSKQIDLVCGKAMKNCNILTTLCGTWWGAQPDEHANNIWSIDSTAIGFWGSEALRTSLGLMRSTPVNILLSESGEMTLEKKRKLLASEFILKRMRYKKNPTLQNIEEIIPFTGFWNNKKPPFVEIYEKIGPKPRLLERKKTTNIQLGYRRTH